MDRKTMTEDEAREKWCHQTGQRCPDMDFGPCQACIASECMAWRWSHGPRLSARRWVIANSYFRDKHGITPPVSSDDVDRYIADVKVHTPKATDFPKPDGDGWRVVTDEPVFEEDTDDDPGWYVEYERPIDPAAAGYCGLAGKP